MSIDNSTSKVAVKVPRETSLFALRLHLRFLLITTDLRPHNLAGTITSKIVMDTDRVMVKAKLMDEAEVGIEDVEGPESIWPRTVHSSKEIVNLPQR